MRELTAYLILLSLSIVSSFAQNSFRRFNGEEGLSHCEVKAIIQDSYGYMWVGTRNKLNRYDGYEFKIFDCNDPVSGKCNNNISAFYEDPERNLWIGTDKGVFVYNPVSNEFTAFERWLANKPDVEWDWVESISEDKDGNAWIMMPNQGILRVKLDSREATLYKVVDRLKPSIDNPQCVAIDFYGTVWVGCNGSGIYKYNKEKDRFEQVKTGNEAFLGKDIYDICHYENYLYVGLHQGELVKYNKVTGKVLANEYPNVNDKIIRCLSVQNENEMWVGTGHGLFILNMFDKSSTNIREDKFDPASISNNTITCIYKDREGGIWIGTMYGGLNYQSGNNKDFQLFTPNSTPESIHSKWIHGLYYDDGSGKLWVGTEDAGCAVSNLETKTFTRVKTTFDVQTLHIKKIRGNIWVGYFKKGLDVISPNMQVTHYDSRDLGLNESSVCAFCEDKEGNVWLGDAWGVYVAPKGSMKFKHVDAFKLGFVQDIIEDKDGEIWVATMGNGVYRYNPATGKAINYTIESSENGLRSNSVSSVMADRKNRIWLSTDRGGICSYNKKTGRFKTYSIDEGLPDDVAFKAVEDRKGNIWFGTNRGLVRLNPEDGQVKVFTYKEGLKVSRFNYNSAIVTGKGQILMGSTDGLIAFNPDKFTQNQYIPPVYFTSFTLNGTEMLPNSINRLGEHHTITLKYNQGNISIRFAALSFTAPAANRYAYFMEGIDVGRTYTNNNLVSYANLPPGNYSFHIKGANNMEKWNENECVLSIHVLPPWWASKWAYLGYIILFIAFIVYLFRAYSRKSARKNEARNLAYTIEKERELYESKMSFFTNITHEIRTPLTLIDGPLEVMLQKPETLPEKSLHYLHIIKQNVDQLLNLVNQLLDFRAAENKHASLSFTNIPIVEFIDKVKERFSVSLAHQNRELKIETSKDINRDFVVAADEDALNKIVNNLLFNAIKYSEKYICLRIGIENDLLVLEFCNDGKLIPAGMQKEIFEPFVRAENSENKMGTGVGLSLCRALTEQHGGTLYYEQQEQLNAFILKIPLNRQTATAEEESATVEDSRIMSKTVEDKECSVRANLLIVEDNAGMMEFLTEQLSESYNILTAGDGLIALDVIRENRVELVLSDVIMPNMNGLTLCRRLKDDVETSHIIVVLLTSKNDVESKIKGLEVGADAYVEKPFNLNYLMVLLKSLIANRNRERNLFSTKPLIPIGQIDMNKTDEIFMNQVIDEINKNISDPAFNVETLVKNMYMSHSNFSRKLKSTVNMTPSDFIRLIRLKKAALLISEGKYRVNEVSLLVGINSTSNFIQMFQKQFGKTPNEFKKECADKEIPNKS